MNWEGIEMEKRRNAVGIDKVYDYLNDAGTYFLATVDGDKPKVRPFGTILLYDGKLYIQTGNGKDVTKQLAENPHAEICACMDGSWLRIAAELVLDNNRCTISGMPQPPSSPLPRRRRSSPSEPNILINAIIFLSQPIELF